jgi:prevent-host-death family protein
MVRNLTNSVTVAMIQINVHEAKAKLTKYLNAALRGERVVIARRNVPLVELTPVAQHPATPRPVGAGPREEGYELPDAFWEPLPEEVVAAFGGEPADAPDAVGHSNPRRP